MENKNNIPTLALPYEFFMKKCILIDDKDFNLERHRIKSSNMALLLSQEDQNDPFSKQFEQVQENLIFATKRLLKKPGNINVNHIQNLYNDICAALKVQDIVKCVEKGLSLFDH